jgi:hypothetical protein
MMGSNGIGDLEHHAPTLEERIEAHLRCAPTDAALAVDFLDPADRRRVRSRALISAVLDACFEHGFPNSAAECHEVDATAELDVWSELASARRAFAHDVTLLNAGVSPQLVLTKIGAGTVTTEPPIRAKVQELILWLAVIHLHEGGLLSNYPTQQSVINKAAAATGRKASSILTELSSYKNQNGPSADQIDHFWNIVTLAQTLARKDGSEKRAFSLLLPAALALSATSMLSAATAKRAP